MVNYNLIVICCCFALLYIEVMKPIFTIKPMDHFDRWFGVMYVWYIHGMRTCHVLHFNPSHNGYIDYIKTMDIVGKPETSILIFEKHFENAFIVFILWFRFVGLVELL